MGRRQFSLFSCVFHQVMACKLWSDLWPPVKNDVFNHSRGDSLIIITRDCVTRKNHCEQPQSGPKNNIKSKPYIILYITRMQCLPQDVRPHTVMGFHSYMEFRVINNLLSWGFVKMWAASDIILITLCILIIDNSPVKYIWAFLY